MIDDDDLPWSALAPGWAEVFTAAERPDLWMAVRAEDCFRSVWPEYNHRGRYLLVVPYIGVENAAVVDVDGRVRLGGGRVRIRLTALPAITVTRRMLAVASGA